MSQELKPRPFCGVADDEGHDHAADCYLELIEYDCMSADLAAAIKDAWNRRATVPAAQQAGWVRVPVEPTDYIMDAFASASREEYADMLKRASKSSAPAEAASVRDVLLTELAGHFAEGPNRPEWLQRTAVLAAIRALQGKPEAATIRNIVGVERSSDQGVTVKFASARAASQFERELGKPEAAKGGELTDEQINALYIAEAFTEASAAEIRFARAIEQHIKGGDNA